jgi:hypothetical protein
MRLTRRNFLQTALAMPIGASFARYRAMAAPAQGLSKITRMAVASPDPGSDLTVVIQT